MRVLTLDRPALKEGNPVHKSFTADDIKVIDEEKRQIDFIISSERVDRMGDVIMLNGWDLKEFKKNPVVLFGHASRVPPIGKALNVRKEDGWLKATAEFMPPEISPFADSIFQMYKGKYLRATSVGFIPTKWEYIEDEKQGITGYRFMKQELIEFSCVPIPANPDALMDARSKGINVDPFKTWAEEVLDNWGTFNADEAFTKVYGVNKKTVEAIRRKAAGSGSLFSLSEIDRDNLLVRNLERVRAQKKEAAKMTNKVKVPFKVGDAEREFEFLVLEGSEEVPSITVEEVVADGTKTINIGDFPQRTALAMNMLSDTTKSFFDLSINKDDALCINISGFDPNGVFSTASYEAFGADEAGTTIFAKLLGVETKQAGSEDGLEGNDGPADEPVVDVKTDGKEGEDTKAEGTGGADEATAGSEASSDPVEGEGTVKLSGDDLSTPTIIDVKGADESADDGKLDVSDCIELCEATLEAMEEALDKIKNSGEKSLGRSEQRKLKNLAMFMREVADRISPESKGAEKAPETKAQVAGGEDEGYTAEDLKELMKSLAPVISSAVNKEINRVRGRLD